MVRKRIERDFEEKRLSVRTWVLLLVIRVAKRLAPMADEAWDITALIGASRNCDPGAFGLPFQAPPRGPAKPTADAEIESRSLTACSHVPQKSAVR